MEENIINFCQICFSISAGEFHIYQSETLQDIGFPIYGDQFFQTGIHNVTVVG